MYHNPVLLHECINGLNMQPDGYYADVTFGGGGHSREMLKKLDHGKLVAFDQDADAAQNKIENSSFIFIQANFRELKKYLQLYQLLPLSGLLADLGVSSYQFDTAERGFSTRFDGKLDMRMDTKNGTTAADILNTYSEVELLHMFRTYGELQNAKRIARLIVTARTTETIVTSDRLKEILQPCMPKGKELKFLAQLYQALRIEVNDELGALKEMLVQAAGVLKPGGRLVVISYHSLEDRMVKNFIRTGNFEGNLEKDFYGNPITIFNQINKKPIVPTIDEIERNSRSRSAKLRIAEKI